MAKKRVGIRNGALFNQTSTLWNNLLAYYTGDGTPNDALGNYNGILLNGTTYGTGIINNGFSFDGVNDTVDFGNNLDFDGSTPFTVSCWVNPNNVTSTQVPLAKAKNTIDYEGYWFLIINGKMNFILSSGINANDWVRVENSITLSTSTWYHCIMTYDGSKSASGLKVYVNNSLNTQNIIKDTLTGSISNTRSFKLGARDNGFFYNGIIDEVGIWDRVLSESEVTELYNSGNGKQYTPPVVSTPSIITDGLVLNLDAGNTLSYPGTGTDWFDLTSNNNDATLINGASYITDGGGSISFDGVNDYALIQNSDTINTVSVTVSMWVKFNTVLNNKVLLSKGGSNRKYWFYEDAGVEFFYVNNRTTKIPKETLLDGNWHNIVGTYDGSSTLSLYHNGVLFGTGACTNTTQTTENLAINAYPTGGYIAGEKYLPTITMYNRALTDSEVLQNYNATKGRFGL
jgi:hypothetical protein